MKKIITFLGYLLGIVEHDFEAIVADFKKTEGKLESLIVRKRFELNRAELEAAAAEAVLKKADAVRATFKAILNGDLAPQS